MNWLTVTFIVTFAASLALTAIVGVVARRCGVVDRPDGQRKLHRGPVARWGGVAVYLALVLGLIVARYGPLGADARFSELSMALIVAAGIVCLFGAVDDCWSLGSRLKLLLQVVAVLPIIGLGYWIDKITAFGVPIYLGWFGAPLTVLWLVGCINSLNLLDGMDGLASMIGCLTAAMLAIIATSLGHDHVSVIALVLTASMAGFLMHNLPPASIFLGDSGSMVIGLALGVLGMQGAMKTSTTLAITIPAIIMALPLFDTLLAVVRRKLTGRRIDSADREHIHHRLLDLGLSTWQALCLIGAICLTTGAAATIATIFRNDSVAWITALALLVLVIRLRLFGHHEFNLTRAFLRRWVGAVVRRTITPIRGSATADAESYIETEWTALIDRLQAFAPGRIDLAIGQSPARLHRFGWSAPGARRRDPAWQLVVTRRRSADHWCKVRISGQAAAALSAEDAATLTRLLDAFVQDLLERPTVAPAWPQVPAIPSPDPAGRQRAA